MRKHVSAGNHSAAMRYRSWDGAEIDRLMEAHDVDLMDWPDIADELGKSVEACVARYRLMGGEVDCKGRAVGKSFRTIHEEAFAERDIRMAAIATRNEKAVAHGDYNHLIFDDPPPGRSALDKMRARA